jgi:hypothetical protein
MRLIDAEAWVDAALALMELALLHIRRIADEDGEWHCALSREPELLDWLVAAVEDTATSRSRSCQLSSRARHWHWKYRDRAFPPCVQPSTRFTNRSAARISAKPKWSGSCLAAIF